MDVFKELTKNIIINDNQGYAFYFYNKGISIEKVNGVLKEANSDKITLDTNFRLASVSKQFIAFSIVNLINKKLLSFDDDIKNIFNDLPDYFKQITIKHLLNHTSGIFDYEDYPHKENDKQIKDNDILDILKNTKETYFKPGLNYRYSNTGYILLGLIVEKISNQKIGNYIEEIFKKAKMNTSKVNYEGITQIPNRAYGHILENNKLYVKDQYWCSATIGDGGLYSSVNDLKNWISYLVTTSNFKEMIKPNYITDDAYNEYGLGIRIIKIDENEIYYHCGDTIGTNTLLLFSTNLKICLIFLTNLGNIDTSLMKDNLLNILKSKAL